MDINNIFNEMKSNLKNRDYSIKERKRKLIDLKNQLIKYKKEILEELKKDTGRHYFESTLVEYTVTIDEVCYAIKNINKWTKKKKIRASLYELGTKAYKQRKPKGLVYIISPWNYPLLLAFVPLIGAIAGGNSIILHPSEKSVHTSKLMHRMLSEIYDEKEIRVVIGDIEVSRQLTTLEFDHIFYTGSTNVGRLITKEASHKLIPLTLELGGKSPCIVYEPSNNIKSITDTILWGKMVNAGQTCVAPDYVYVHESVYDSFVSNIKKSYKDYFKQEEDISGWYPRIVNKESFDRIKESIDNSIARGNKSLEEIKYDEDKLFISPVLMEMNNEDDKIDPLLNKEIFGPILPIVKFNDLNKVINKINDGERPLTSYLFTKNKKVIKKLDNELIVAGMITNNVLIQLANSKLPFGGVNTSGYGSSKGVYSFNEFTYLKTTLKQGRLINLSKLGHYPYTDKKYKLIKKLRRLFGKY